MNILIPDNWLREFLETEATPRQIKEYLSLCGPSVERIHEKDGEVIYDVEVTSNRPDSMSVLGVAREAAAILPRFGIPAKLIKDPYSLKIKNQKSKIKNLEKKLHIETDPQLNPRWVSVVMDNVKIRPSPDWLQKKLELTGIRSLNNIVDITNYFLRAYGQPVHAFDYDEIKPNQDSIPTMILRAAKRGEKITTLDGKTHTLPGGDIVIEDSAGRLIDLCGIMGAQNSSVKSTTKTIVLFMQTYNPAQIRQTSMTLAHRTEAAALFEKGLDEELVLATMLDGIELVTQLSGGEVKSEIYDLYPKPYQPYQVSVTKEKVHAYIGKKLTGEEIEKILTPIGLTSQIDKKQISVTVPSFRRDIEIDVDVIEEIARLYGYHNIKATLPDAPPPFTQPDRTLEWEDKIKVRLRDWGFTETYTYSMISEELMDLFDLDKTKAYKIANPLSNEWVYMRPSLWPSVLTTVKQNLNLRSDFKLFELSMRYRFQEKDLPKEEPVLLISWPGAHFLEAKGVVEAIFTLFGIQFPQQQFSERKIDWYDQRFMDLGAFGSLGMVSQNLLNLLEIKTPVTIIDLEFSQLVTNAKSTHRYQPIAKYPPVIEDLTFVLPERTPIGHVLETIKKQSRLIYSTELISQYQNAATFRINYLDRERQLTDMDVAKLRHKICEVIENSFKAKLKGITRE